ncbi:ATP-binding protein [Hymenobacter seoulensis]
MPEAHAALDELTQELVEQRQLHRILAQNPNPIYRLQAGSRLLYANPAAERLQQELATGTELLSVVQAWVEESLRTGRELRRDVAAADRHFSVCIVPDETVQQVTLYVTEVTDRVQAQSQRASQQAFTEQVLNALPCLVSVRDAAGRYVYRNGAAQELAELLTKAAPTPEVAARQAEQQAASAAADAQVLATGQQLMVEEEVALPGGENHCLQTAKRPLVWEGGARHVLAVSTDVTELKQAREAAEAAATARANFLANMSHEIRTPLNGVLGIAAQLAKTPLDARQQELLQIVQTSGRHLLGIINDVLDMAKITSGKLELAQDAFDVCEMLFQAASPLLQQAQEKGITVVANRLQDSCPNPQVVGDLQRLSQVVLNLLSNAIKFTPSGGEITASGYQVGETEDTLTIEFSFRDTGVGIAPDKLERIFEDFTQAYADTSRQFGGTGLGLSISRALVKQMGGELTVTSTLGQGSTFAFTITLPRAKGLAPASADSPAASPYTALRGRRVLLVEDNEINRLVAVLLLTEWGVGYDEAEDGAAGVALAAVHAYDVVLMDVQMPGMSGLEATAAIRALPDPARAGVPIVALTANAFEADRQQCLAAGMQACVAKPFDEAALYHTLTEVLSIP